MSNIMDMDLHRARIGRWELPVAHFLGENQTLAFPVIGMIGNSVPTSDKGKRTLFEWKIAIAEATKTLRGSTPWDPNWHYAVSIGFAFHMGSHGNQRLDVENFIKPCLDALAAGLFYSDQTVPREINHWKYDDSNFKWLFIQRLRDVGSSTEEGATIHLSVKKIF